MVPSTKMACSRNRMYLPTLNAGHRVAISWTVFHSSSPFVRPLIHVRPHKRSHEDERRITITSTFLI